MVTYITYFLFFVLGYALCNLLVKYSSYLTNKKIITDINNQFIQILDNIKSGKSKFSSRVNNTVYIKTDLIDYGEIDVVYFIDKQGLGIFKEGKCLYSDHKLDKDIMSNIIVNIKLEYSDEISDVVEVLGFVFSRADFEKTFNVDMKQLQEQSRQMNLLNKMDDKSDIEKIMEKNDIRLDLDGILDRISCVGYENLTPEEKDFLDKMSK